MHRSIRILVVTVLFSAVVVAQDLQLEKGAVGSYLRLKELQTTGSVLHVVAHPDDEDGAMLAYCARGLGAQTMLFSITRGEGGANMISSHFFDELGALRTLEHLKAASYYGINVFYSRAADYGYSKTLEEAMRQWQNGIPILEDLVEVIRRERPTVMLSRFAGDPRDGHGHHQMAGVVSRLAFDAAADPDKFPEQIARGYEPWQVKKLYVRAGSPWREPKEGEWTIALPTGTFDPVIGRSYAQIARFGLGFQRSQGITGHDGDAGPRSSYYRLVKQAKEGELATREDSLFEGLDTSLPSIVDASSGQRRRTKEELTEIESALKQAFAKWNPLDGKKTVNALTRQLASLRSTEVWREGTEGKLPYGFEQDFSRLDRRLQDAIVATAGLQLEVWATDSNAQEINHAVRDERIQFHVRLANQGNHSIQTESLTIKSSDGWQETDEKEPTMVAPSEVYEATVRKHLTNSTATLPHWSRENISKPLYQAQPTGGQRPTPISAFEVSLPVSINGVRIDLVEMVQTRIRHPEYGQVRYPLTVAPAMSVHFPSTAGINPRARTDYTLPVVVRSCRKGRASATTRLNLPPGWSAVPSNQTVNFEREDEEATIAFKITIPANAASKQYSITAVVESEGEEFHSGFETVSARDVGRMNIYHDAVHRVQIADVEVAGSPTVGYIPGSGDKVAESLAPLEIFPTMLSESDLASGDLSRFDVILVGVRAYAVREDIRTHNSRLLDYVKRGGTLVVQYQTPEFDANFGPYPYVMGRRPEEVSEEDSQVTVLEPAHPIFTTPNMINTGDFEGWFEQRGSKFWTTWDDQYTALLECHDTGQPPQKGGMLIAKYGKGVYVYSAYAWYRQLPNGVPGAYRLFANMLSLPKSGLVE